MCNYLFSLNATNSDCRSSYLPKFSAFFKISNGGAAGLQIPFEIWTICKPTSFFLLSALLWELGSLCWDRGYGAFESTLDAALLNQPLFDHSKSGRFQILDLHCSNSFWHSKDVHESRVFLLSCKCYILFYSGVGKTQLLMFLSVKTVLNVDGNVLYVDTKNDFCIERLTQMIETNLPKNSLTLSKKRDYVLDKIRVCKLYDLATLLKVLSSIIHNQVMYRQSSVKTRTFSNLTLYFFIR